MTRAAFRFPSLEEARAALPEVVSKNILPSQTGCWEWSGILMEGRPTLYVSPSETRDRKHRIAVRRFVFVACGGVILPGSYLRNRCANPRCVSPHHLRWVVDGITPRFDDLVEAWLRTDDPTRITQAFATPFDMSRWLLRATLLSLADHPERMRPDQWAPFQRAMRSLRACEAQCA